MKLSSIICTDRLIMLHKGLFLLGLILHGSILIHSATINRSKNEALYLSPYIESNRLDEGRKLANVTGLEWNVTSYSGMLTVNKKYDSNMFFWYFPAERKPAEVPLLLWLNGFSTASTYGIFLQTGPYSVTKGNVLLPRNTSWQKYYHVLYIDNPVGVGFSYTRSNEGYSTNLNVTSTNLKIALGQFLQLFPELSNRELYLTGLSLGGKYISSLAYALHGDKSFNLKGIFIGNPLLNPAIQFHFKNYLHELGFTDDKEEKELLKLQQTMLKYLSENDSQQFYKSAMNFILDDNSYLVNVTGLFSIYDYENPYLVTSNYDVFINDERVKNAIHVGNMEFNNGAHAMELFSDGFSVSVTGMLEAIIEDTKMLFYAGQLDVICAYPMLVDTLNSMNWTGKEGYANADRVKLHQANSSYVWGYLKNYKTITDVMVRKAGHSAVSSQPDHIFYLLQHFTDYSRFL